MFENIIGHTATVAALRGELADGKFPRSALFVGPPYTGKLSTALEAARVLTCSEGRGEWSCECPSCRMQKELSHPLTVLLGPRYSDVEIAASADALMRSRKPATVYLLLRAVRKLTRRFDPWIADADDARVKGMQDRVAQLEELADRLAPGADLRQASWENSLSASPPPPRRLLRRSGRTRSRSGRCAASPRGLISRRRGRGRLQ